MYRCRRLNLSDPTPKGTVAVYMSSLLGFLLIGWAEGSGVPSSKALELARCSICMHADGQVTNLPPVVSTGARRNHRADALFPGLVSQGVVWVVARLSASLSLMSCCVGIVYIRGLTERYIVNAATEVSVVCILYGSQHERGSRVRSLHVVQCLLCFLGVDRVLMCVLYSRASESGYIPYGGCR